MNEEALKISEVLGTRINVTMSVVAIVFKHLTGFSQFTDRESKA